MGNYSEGCLICGQELEYLKEPVKGECTFCGKVTTTLIICSKDHFVCDKCHSADGLKILENFCFNSKTKEPIELANIIMRSNLINMHGPEHHSIVPAVVVTAYKNKTGLLSEKHINEAIFRGSQIQGGSCGNFGACGAGIGAGIAISIINGTTPLSVVDWGEANLMTAKALQNIGQKGGPRCCKRCTWTAIESAVEYIAQTKNIKLDIFSNDNKCTHYHRNKQCQGKKCSYFPIKIKEG